MPLKTHTLAARLDALDGLLAALRCGGGEREPILRWQADAAAVRFHLRGAEKMTPAVVILGGTGTGKSTLVNRLLDANLTATSFRRAFTTGAIALAAEPSRFAPDWLGVKHVQDEQSPARGQSDALVVIECAHELTRAITLVDTPDLDGDQASHPLQADRAFRWAQAVLFVVTPEKYQMTELLPYYRLARRYGLTALFVMNKTEEAAVVEDYRRQLTARDWPAASIFTLPRDDAAYEPAPDANLAALSQALRSPLPNDPAVRESGLRNRLADLLDRLRDQVLSPLREDRRQIAAMSDSLSALEIPGAGIDVNPLTVQLQRRLRQRSVLYLMGPRRMLDRVRQVPSMLARLPRTMWDVVVRGESVNLNVNDTGPDSQQVPEFRSVLIDQFTIVQTRIADVMRSDLLGERLLARPDATAEIMLDPAAAGKIADEELADLTEWLSKRWNGTPRDTMLLQKLLKHLPGGQKLAQWSEAAPYLLALIVATHHVFFGPTELIVVGGFSLATWLTEKLSNEVASRTRRTNRRLAERFAELAHDQIVRVREWLQSQAPPADRLDQLQRAIDDASEEAGLG